MSRKYVNDRWCVRCGKTKPTPYLRQKVSLLQTDIGWQDSRVIDIGCGNGRNLKFMQEIGFKHLIGIDMAVPTLEGICLHKTTLGVEPLPLSSHTVDVILANYILMFLSEQELSQTLSEITRIASPKCWLITEMYPAKDSYCKTELESETLLYKIRDNLIKAGWRTNHSVKQRLIMRKD
jgi:ubiquinone/menaquinone biosynthesis C-methylase UbiE